MAPASVNLTSNSSACFPLYDAARLSPSFAKFCQAYIIVVAALLVLSNLALIKHRRKPYLAKRSPKLILLQSLYVPLALLVGPVAMLYPDKIKCDLFYWASMMIIPIASVPLVIRVVMWHYRVKLNSRVAEIAATDGKYKVKLKAKADVNLKWLASQSGGIQLTVGFCSVIGIPLILFSDALFCRTCISFLALSIIKLLLLLPGVVLLIITLVKLRKVPDTMNLVGEIWTMAIFGCLVSVVGAILKQTNALDVYGEVTTNFDWLFLQEIGLLWIYIVVCPLQVFRATCRAVKPPSTKSLLSLPRVLKDKQALKYFVMYCSTELSLENLLFYQCVNAWKSNSTEERLKEEGLQLYENFFAPGSVFELNLNDKTLQTVRDSFEAGECNRQIFDTAMDEVYEILVTTTFPAFLQSNICKLYHDQQEPSQIEQLTFSGASSFKHFQKHESKLNCSVVRRTHIFPAEAVKEKE